MYRGTQVVEIRDDPCDTNQRLSQVLHVISNIYSRGPSTCDQSRTESLISESSNRLSHYRVWSMLPCQWKGSLGNNLS